MLIYCKMLDNKNIGYTNYYLLQLKKLIKERLNENLYLHIYKEQKEDFYINTYSDNKKHGHFFITPSVSVIFYCNENKIASSDNGQFNNYIFRLTYNILAICHVLSNIDYYEKDKSNSSIIINTYYSRNRGKEITDTYKQNKKELKDILTDIAINHWKEVKNNIEAFNLFCKSENKDINYNKIARSINFIKEYVRDIYKYTIV